MPLAGGIATFTGEGSPPNKVAGLGFAGPLDESDLDAVERAFAERLAAAEGFVRAGCDVAVVTTQPGSSSQENVQRQGFELLYVRAVLVCGA